MLENLPFTVPVNVRTLSKKGQHFKFEPDEQQLMELVETYDLVSIDSFILEAHVSPWRKGGVRIEGQVRAQFMQPCAVTAEPLAQTMNEAFETLFVPEGSKLTKPPSDGEGEIVVDVEGEDPPETFAGDSIDLAGVWLEFFALGLDPFARLEGAQLPDEVTPKPEEELEEDRQQSPFAALADWKKH